MKSNESLQKDVQDAIKWEPLLNAAEIGVTARDGIVTLTGKVNSYSKKLEAEDAARSVAGVKAVIEKIELNFGYSNKIGDDEIARDVLLALRWDRNTPTEKIAVTVEDGYVTLTGDVMWNYEKESAQLAVSNVTGVKSVLNHITIRFGSHDQVEKDAIKYALLRNASIDDDEITVIVKENHVTLTGTVDSFYEREEAEREAWKAPGVSFVDNDLVVEYDGYLV